MTIWSALATIGQLGLARDSSAREHPLAVTVCSGIPFDAGNTLTGWSSIQFHQFDVLVELRPELR